MLLEYAHSSREVHKVILIFKNFFKWNCCVFSTFIEIWKQIYRFRIGNEKLELHCTFESCAWYRFHHFIWLPLSLRRQMKTSKMVRQKWNYTKKKVSHINQRTISVQTRRNYVFNRKLLGVNETAFIGNETIPEVITEVTIINDEITTVTSKPVKNCTRAAIMDFPSDGLNRHQRRHGWIALHILIACYCFWLLAIVCDDYFVPAIGIMCFSKYNC